MQSLYEMQTKKLQGEMVAERHKMEQEDLKQKQKHVLFKKTKWTIEAPLDRSFINSFYDKKKYDSYLFSQEKKKQQKRLMN